MNRDPKPKPFALRPLTVAIRHALGLPPGPILHPEPLPSVRCFP